MNIEFSDEYTKHHESGRFTFWAKVDGKKIQCDVSDEYLQDRDPSNAKENIEELFKRYRPILEDIVKEKILAPEFNWEKVSITRADIP